MKSDRLLGDVEAEATEAFTTAGFFAATDPQMHGAVDPARVLEASRDAGAFSRYFFVRLTTEELSERPWRLFAGKS